MVVVEMRMGAPEVVAAVVALAKGGRVTVGTMVAMAAEKAGTRVVDMVGMAEEQMVAKSRLVWESCTNLE